MNIAKVTSVLLKPASGVLMETQTSISLEKGFGIIGDNNASSISPRQVLITRLEDLEYFQIKPGDLRENIVISGISSADFQPGAVLRLGEKVSVRLTFFCEPCKRIAHLVKISEVMKRRGILGVVLSSGGVQKGDTVLVEPNKFDPLPEVPYERFLEFIKNVPASKVITYRDVTVGMGVAESYMRAVPAYIRKTDSSMYPIHRIVDTEGNLITEYVKEQREQLEAEAVGLYVENDLFGDGGVTKVNLQKHHWKNGELYLIG